MCVYNTPMNTVGIGDPVPFGANGSYGSGDLFGSLFPALPKAPKSPKSPKSPKLPYTKKAVNFFEQRPLIVMKNKKG